MQDRIAFRLVTRYMYNQVLWQMLQGPQKLLGFAIEFETFKLPMHSGAGFFLIHLWESYSQYGKSTNGRIHEFAKECRRFVGENYAMRSGLQLPLMELQYGKFIKTRITFDTPDLIMPSAFWRRYDTGTEIGFFSAMWLDYWGAIK